MNDVTHPNDYERSDADPRLIAALALGVAAFLVVTPFALLAVYPGADRLGSSAGRAAAAAAAASAGRAQGRSRRPSRRRSSERLTSFGWVDRDRQIVRIPIERAMGLLAERGLPELAVTAAQRRHRR